MAFYQQGSHEKSYVYEYYFCCSTMNSSTFIYFHAFVFISFPFFFSNHLSDFLYFLYKLLIKNKSPDLSSLHWTIFFFNILQHYETWNVIDLFPSHKLEEIELILIFKSCSIQIYMNSMFHTEKLVESCKLYHANCLSMLTGKECPKIKLQRLWKIRIWTFALLVHQINSF